MAAAWRGWCKYTTGPESGLSEVALLPPAQENVGSIPARHELFN